MAEKSPNKSDFIVNMTKPQFNKLCGIFFIAASILYFVVQAVYYITKDVVVGKDLEGANLYATAYTLPLQFTVIIITGFLAALPFVIAALKKYLTKAHLKVLIIPLLFTALSIIACLLAYNPDYTMYGQVGRYDGVVAQLAFFLMIAGAMMMTSISWMKRISYTIIIIGTLNSVIGIFQTVTPLKDIIPSFYAKLRFGFSSEYAANGFTSSPYFLCGIVAISLALTFSIFLYEKQKSLKIALGCGAVLQVAALSMTRVLTGILAIIAAFVPVIVVEIVRLAKKHTYINGKKLENPIFVALASAAVAACVAVAGVFLSGGLIDRAVAVEDGMQRLFVSGAESVGNSQQFYLEAWEESLVAIKDKPILGVGGDCYAEYIYGSQPSTVTGSFDRPYNDYIYYAASKGVPCAVIYLAFIVMIFIKTAKRAKGFYNNTEGITQLSLGLAAVAYSVTMIIGFSSISCAPFFFITAGLLFAQGE